MATKCVFICLDGLGDRYHEQLGGTPLQAAYTPHLDKLAAFGATGLYHPDILGVPLSSPEAHFAIYGYERSEIPARSVLEAVAAGLPVRPEDCFMLARLACGDNNSDILMLTDREPKGSPEELTELRLAVREFESSDVAFELFELSGIKHVIRMTGFVSPYVTDSDPQRAQNPLALVRPREERKDDPAALNTSKALNDYVSHAFRTLSDHPVSRDRVERGLLPINLVLTYFGGAVTPLGSFTEKWGMRAVSISSKPVQWGIAKLIGMDASPAETSPDPEREIADRLETARSKLSDYDFFHVHTMAPDEAAHTKNPVRKKEVIEALDRGLGRSIGPLVDDPEVLLVITSDHSTPSSGSLIHSGEPVPVMFVGEGARRDGAQRFDEAACAAGALGLIRGGELIRLILDLTDRSLMPEVRYTTSPKSYWSDDYEPFRLK